MLKQQLPLKGIAFTIYCIAFLCFFINFFLMKNPSSVTGIITLLGFLAFNSLLYIAATNSCSNTIQTIFSFWILFILVNFCNSLAVAFLMRSLEQYSVHQVYSVISLTILTPLIIRLLLTKKSLQVNFNSKALSSLILICICVFIAQYIFRQSTGIDITRSSDELLHMTAMKEIFINGNIQTTLPQINEGFTLTTYLPIFHYILGPIVYSGGVLNPVTMYSIIEIVFSAVAGITTFFLLKSFLKSTESALFGTIISIFAFEATSAGTTFYLLPQTLTALIGFTSFIYFSYTEKIEIVAMIISTAILIANHFYIGTLFVLTTYLAIITRISKSSILLYKVLIATLAIATVAAVVLEIRVVDIYKLIVPTFSIEDRPFTYIDSNKLFEILKYFYGIFVVGMLLAVLGSMFTKNKKYVEVTMIVALVVFLIIVDFPYAGKAFTLFHYFTVVLLAILFSYVKTPSFRVNTLLCILTAICMIPVLNTNTSRHTQPTPPENRVGLNTTEYALAASVLHNYPKNLLIISDPLTMQIIEPLVYQRTRGGMYAATEFRLAIWDFLNKKDF